MAKPESAYFVKRVEDMKGFLKYESFRGGAKKFE
jgi:hypothetical protein